MIIEVWTSSPSATSAWNETLAFYPVKTRRRGEIQRSYRPESEDDIVLVRGKAWKV